MALFETTGPACPHIWLGGHIPREPCRAVPESPPPRRVRTCSTKTLPRLRSARWRHPAGPVVAAPSSSQVGQLRPAGQRDGPEGERHRGRRQGERRVVDDRHRDVEGLPGADDALTDGGDHEVHRLRRAHDDGRPGLDSGRRRSHDRRQRDAQRCDGAREGAAPPMRGRARRREGHGHAGVLLMCDCDRTISLDSRVAPSETPVRRGGGRQQGERPPVLERRARLNGRMHDLSPAQRALAASLAHDLADADYGSRSLRELWGDVADDALTRGDAVPARRALGRHPDSPLATLASLFFLGDASASEAAAAALSQVGIDGSRRTRTPPTRRRPGACDGGDPALRLHRREWRG